MIAFLELLLKIPIDTAAFLIRKIKEWCTWQGKYIKQAIPESFRKEYLGPTQIYVQPFITPNRISLDHPETTDSGKQVLLKDYFITKVFTDTADEPTVICLLGDSGSGKSSALVHLLYDYIHHYKSKGQLPFPHIKLLSLRNQMDFHAIDSIPDKEHTILLLDALDECPQVQSSEDFERFLTALRNAYSDFARVVITCRPQFFPDNDHQSVLAPNDISNEVSFLQCENRYLAPFNDTQIDSFLSHKFSFRHDSSAYKDACEIINQAPLLFIRPLVLTYIDILIKSQQPIKTPLDVHYCIIHELLKRDIGLKIFSGNIEQRVRNWWQLSAIAAAHMYQRGEQSLTDKEFDELLNKSENIKILSSDKARNFKRRSLLTRTGDEYHFSHRSFFEFFLAYYFLQHPKEIKYIGGLDFALEIFDQLYDAFTNGNKKPFSMLNAEVKEEDFAFAFLSISNSLDDLNHFSKALPSGQKAVDIFSRLSQTDSDAYLRHKAGALNNLAILHADTNNHAAAEKEYTEALSIRRSLDEANPDAFLPDVAMTLNNLAILHANTNNHAAAEEEFTKALSIRRSLAETNPDAFLPHVATTLNNLANLHNCTNNHTAAEEEYTEALNIRRSLAEANPDAFLPDVAMTLNNLAVLHDVTDNHAAAEKEYTEALDKYRSLAETNPDAFLLYVAMTLNNLAILHKNTDNHAAAEEEYTEALSIRRSLAEANPDAFLPDVAMTLFNIALLHFDKGELDEAERAAQESLDIFRTMAEKSHVAFDMNVKKGEVFLADIQKLRTVIGGTE